jgi:hypothetical protein
VTYQLYRQVSSPARAAVRAAEARDEPAHPQAESELGDEADLTFEELVALASERGELRWIGTFPDLDAATMARHDDVVEVLADRQGRWTLQRHLIVGPGLSGPETEHWSACHVGPDPDIPQVEPSHQLVATLIDTMLWLDQMRNPSS